LMLNSQLDSSIILSLVSLLLLLLLVSICPLARWLCSFVCNFL
jgi:hypothetical protein